MSQFQEYFQNKLPDYLELLRQMVGINSFTANAQGVNELAALTADAFARLGFKAEYVQSDNPDYGKHLFLTHTATEQAASSASPKTIACISHLDTVFSPEEEIENNFYWHKEGDRFYGPGTNDIKGGTVMIYMLMEALQALEPQVFYAVNWVVCLNASEEVLAHDFGMHCQEHLPTDTTVCLVFEGGTPAAEENAFSFVVARKGRATFRVQAEGRSAHAGNYHAQGANAILQMAQTVQKIAALTDYAQEITFNVGTIRGGSVVNRVPHLAEVEVEMRAFSPQVFADGCEAILALNGDSDIASVDGFPCKVTVKLETQSDPWPRNPNTDWLFDHWLHTADQLGITTQPEKRGGLSDGNLLWKHFPTIDGLGPAGANAHCSERSPDGSKDQEYVLASSFVPRATLNALAILGLLKP